MRTSWQMVTAMTVPATLALLQACAGEAPTTPERAPIQAIVGPEYRVWVFHARLDEIVMDDPNAEQPNLNGGFVQVKVFQEENERFFFVALATLPNSDDVLFGGGDVIDPSGGVLFELEDGCRSCPIVMLRGSAEFSLELFTEFFKDPENFIAVVAFEGGMLSGHFGPPIPEEIR